MELRQLWHGKLPFSRAFWTYAFAYGLAINLLMGGLALIAYAVSQSVVLFLALHFLPLPYNVMACAGAWKSLNRSARPGRHGEVAKLAIVILFIALSLL